MFTERIKKDSCISRAKSFPHITSSYCGRGRVPPRALPGGTSWLPAPLGFSSLAQHFFVQGTGSQGHPHPRTGCRGYKRPCHLGRSLCMMSATKFSVGMLLLSRFNRVWLWDPMDSSPPGSSVQRILQARILEGVAISFSNSTVGMEKPSLAVSEAPFSFWPILLPARCSASGNIPNGKLSLHIHSREPQWWYILQGEIVSYFFQFINEEARCQDIPAKPQDYVVSKWEKHLWKQESELLKVSWRKPPWRPWSRTARPTRCPI